MERIHYIRFLTHFADTVFNSHNQIGLSVRGDFRRIDIVKSFERWNSGVDFNNDLISHLDQLRRSTNRGTRNNTTILSNSSGLDDDNVQVGTVRLVLGVVS